MIGLGWGEMAGADETGGECLCVDADIGESCRQERWETRIRGAVWLQVAAVRGHMSNGEQARGDDELRRTMSSDGRERERENGERAERSLKRGIELINPLGTITDTNLVEAGLTGWC